MQTWLSVILIFIALIIILIFIGWIDWKFKCRKTIKENKLNFYVLGYAILFEDENDSNIVIIDGLLGANSSELVFGNRFQDDVINIKEELSKITYIDVLEHSCNEIK